MEDEEIFREVQEEDIPPHLRARVQAMADLIRERNAPQAMKRGKGRPRKDSEDKYRRLTIRLAPYYAGLLKKIGGDVGPSLALRAVLAEYEVLKTREERQVKSIGTFSLELEALAAQLQAAVDARDIKRAEEVEAVIVKKSNILKKLLSLMSFEGEKYDVKKRGETGDLVKKHHDYLEDLLQGSELDNYKLLKRWTKK